jgi:abortive infection bacteriophage resistance protein
MYFFIKIAYNIQEIARIQTQSNFLTFDNGSAILDFSDQVSETLRGLRPWEDLRALLFYNFLKEGATDLTKPFLTYDQQLNKLSQEKELIINNPSLALETLKNIGYFPVIGGYKTPFINPMTRIYEKQTTFEDILALYCFDRDLRDIFFRHLCEVELRIRQLISNYFCAKYGELQSSYLSSSSYDCSTTKKHAAVSKLISILDYHATHNTNHKYLVYQRNTHGNVPLWIATKALTFGQISKLYSLLKFQMKTDISNEFTHVSEDVLGTYLEKLCLVRNACAHSERLYCFRFDKDFPDTDLHRKLNIPMKGEQYIYGKNDLFAAVIALRYLLPRKDFISFKNELSKCINRYLRQTRRIERTELYSYMGFPENWDKITRYQL